MRSNNSFQQNNKTSQKWFIYNTVDKDHKNENVMNQMQVPHIGVLKNKNSRVLKNKKRKAIEFEITENNNSTIPNNSNNDNTILNQTHFQNNQDQRFYEQLKNFNETQFNLFFAKNKNFNHSDQKITNDALNLKQHNINSYNQSHTNNNEEPKNKKLKKTELKDEPFDEPLKVNWDTKLNQEKSQTYLLDQGQCEFTLNQHKEKKIAPKTVNTTMFEVKSNNTIIETEKAVNKPLLNTHKILSNPKSTNENVVNQSIFIDNDSISNLALSFNEVDKFLTSLNDSSFENLLNQADFQSLFENDKVNDEDQCKNIFSL